MSNVNRPVSPVSFAALSAGVFILAQLSATAAWAQVIRFVPQPANQHATLIDSAGQPIRDDTFAGWVSNGLRPNIGVGAVTQSATFVFNTCFGGGMLDDLQSVLSAPGVQPVVPFLGGAASRHDQAAFGQIPRPAAGVPFGGDPVNYPIPPIKPYSMFTQALLPFINPGLNQDWNTAINSAINSDLDGPVAGPARGKAAPNIEDGQLTYASGGQNNKITEPASAAGNFRYAIFWAGQTDAIRHFNNTQAMIDRVTGAWAAAGVPFAFSVLYGDGTNRLVGNAASGAVPDGWKAATPANLKARIENIPAAFGQLDQFFFYATDHGGNTAIAFGGRVGGAGGPAGTFLIPTIAPGTLHAMEQSGDNVPTLAVDFSGLNGSAEVLIGTHLVGTFSDFTGLNGQRVFTLDESWLTADNVVSIRSLSGGDFNIDQIEFFTGGIGEIQSVPEPAAAGLFLLGLAFLTACRRRN
jgi:hypothetical protein